ncbi:MAG: tryptophan 7-halogenase, partial [Gammaproteobacteria bacterium]|nr:tryptophan 7-halogenase [Gammaproteobacteria bacterium]
WSTHKGFESYYHPFFTMSDDATIRAFAQNVAIRNKNFKAHAHPDAFFVSNYLAKSRRAPLPDEKTQYKTDYGYHFDAKLIGDFLKKKCVEQGVKHVIDTVTAVNRKATGEIESVQTEQHGVMEADLFVDSSGFKSLLIGEELNVPFKSYGDVLFNDRAVALPTPLDSEETLPSQTVSTALKCGWVWKIPLTNRFGNGYVYSSSHLTADAAEKELREHIQLPDESVEARHLEMRVGRLERHWEQNCLAVGLSQGFIEPLEATALMIVQDTIENFISLYERGGFTDKYQRDFNTKVNLIFDSIKDFIFMHYKLNSRSDTDYWIENRENQNVSDSVTRILDVWDNGGDLLSELMSQSDHLAYSPTSWFCILAGMGRFPKNPKKVKKKANAVDPDEVRRYCEQIVPHFPDHRTLIDRMATLAA